MKPMEVPRAQEGRTPIKHQLHQHLLRHFEIHSGNTIQYGDLETKARARQLLLQYVQQKVNRSDLHKVVEEVIDEALGLGPLESFLRDPDVSEVMVVGPRQIFVERAGRLSLSDRQFSSMESLRIVIDRIVAPLGRRIDDASPLVDGRLQDGSRVHAAIAPVVLNGPTLTLRRHRVSNLGLENLVTAHSLDIRMARFLRACITSRKNIIVSGGTGSGKTTLLNALSAFIPPSERVITIEDVAELKLAQPHVVSLETKAANLDGAGAIPIRVLVQNALRMRPDRIIVGECRGGEALDMLQAMNTGHDGSMTTLHANNPQEAMLRLETLALLSGTQLPIQALRQQISRAVHVIVQVGRTDQGSRRVKSIAVVEGMEHGGSVRVEEVYRWCMASAHYPEMFRPTGFVPHFLTEWVQRGRLDPSLLF